MRARHSYHGRLVHRRRSRHGVIEVVDDQLTRSLHFGDSTRQSAMYLDHPAVLVLEYTQSMMACLLFNPRPRRILLLGLGGGSLAKFLLQHYPESAVDAVEPERAVLEVARSHFELPTHARLNVHLTDAVSFLNDRCPQPMGYDVILMDIYDANGMVPSMTQADFLASARASLSTRGVLAVNLSRPERALYRQALRNLRRCFPGCVYRLPVIEKGNEIAFALGPGVEPESLKALQRRAEFLRQRLGLDFRDYLSRIRRHNPSLLERLLT